MNSSSSSSSSLYVEPLHLVAPAQLHMLLFYIILCGDDDDVSADVDADAVLTS